jgi:hypothetical protein
VRNRIACRLVFWTVVLCPGPYKQPWDAHDAARKQRTLNTFARTNECAANPGKTDGAVEIYFAAMSASRD